MIVRLHLEPGPPGLSFAVLDALCGLLERGLVGGGDLLEELRVVTAAFAADMHIVGHHIGGVAGGPAFAAGHRPDIAGALLLSLDHLAEPAAGLDLRERQSEDHRGADAALRRAAGMRGAAEDLHLPAIRSDRAHHDVGRQTAHR